MPMLQKMLFSKHLDDDEVLVKVVHKHWLVGFNALFWPTVFLALAALLALAFPTRPMLIVAAVFAVVVSVWWLRNFFDYYLDAWIITSEGIIDVAWHGFFHRESARILYSDIQGVSYEIKGVVGTLLQVGVIAVEKISTGDSVSLEWVKRPKKVESLLLANQEKYLHKKNLRDGKEVQKMLASLLADQMNMKELGITDDDADE
jgi:hypothetical protein